MVSDLAALQALVEQVVSKQEQASRTWRRFRRLNRISLIKYRRSLSPRPAVSRGGEALQNLRTQRLQSNRLPNHYRCSPRLLKHHRQETNCCGHLFRCPRHLRKHQPLHMEGGETAEATTDLCEAELASANS
jgi:hypothetical protein